jgi:hypothetical protein
MSLMVRDQTVDPSFTMEMDHQKIKKQILIANQDNPHSALYQASKTTIVHSRFSVGRNVRQDAMR